MLTRPTPPGLRHIGEPTRRVVDELALKVAAKALADRDCTFDGPNIVIPCADYGEAIRLMTDLRVALGIAA